MREDVANAAEIVAFWTEAGPDRWYKKDASFDDEIRRRFLPAYEAARAGALSDWEASAEGALALLILTDQFPRNLFRGQAEAFATDEMARGIANRAVSRGHDQAYEPPVRGFFYLPFEHSESLADQTRACDLFEASGDEEGLKWARIHEEIIRRFGRFPHRNAVLGRETSAEERVFLDEGGFAG